METRCNCGEGVAFDPNFWIEDDTCDVHECPNKAVTWCGCLGMALCAIEEHREPLEPRERAGAWCGGWKAVLAE